MFTKSDAFPIIIDACFWKILGAFIRIEQSWSIFNTQDNEDYTDIL